MLPTTLMRTAPTFSESLLVTVWFCPPPTSTDSLTPTETVRLPLTLSSLETS
jgi:hypothetical protein